MKTPTTRTDYPSDHPPGSHWSTDAAWAILDSFRPDELPQHVRFLLAGMVAGQLMKERSINAMVVACLKEIATKRTMDAAAASSMRANARDALRELEG